MNIRYTLPTCGFLTDTHQLRPVCTSKQLIHERYFQPFYSPRLFSVADRVASNPTSSISDSDARVRRTLSHAVSSIPISPVNSHTRVYVFFLTLPLHWLGLIRVYDCRPAITLVSLSFSHSSTRVSHLSGSGGRQ